MLFYCLFIAFFDGWFFEPGTIDLDSFCSELFLSGTESGLFWHHVNVWWAQKNSENVLFLCYENMLSDPDKLIRDVAAFINIDLDDELRDITRLKTSAQYMRQHTSRFDDHFLRAYRDSACLLPVGGESAKISDTSTSSTRIELSSAIQQSLDKKWREFTTPITGLNSYVELRDQINSSI